MFEFIGIVVVCWFAFKIVMAFVRAKGTSTSREYGLEARRIATEELGIPNSYYNSVTINHIDDLKKAALMMKEVEEFKNTSWPRLIALSIFGWFHLDCNKFHNGDTRVIQLFRTLQIQPSVIATTLMQDPEATILRHS